MSGAVRTAVLNTIGRQQAALELAIEHENVGLQLMIWQRMTVLERALSGDDDGRQVED
jgi:hypothetical protein